MKQSIASNQYFYAQYTRLIYRTWFWVVVTTNIFQDFEFFGTFPVTTTSFKLLDYGYPECHVDISADGQKCLFEILIQSEVKCQRIRRERDILSAWLGNGHHANTKIQVSQPFSRRQNLLQGDQETRVIELFQRYMYWKECPACVMVSQVSSPIVKVLPIRHLLINF